MVEQYMHTPAGLVPAHEGAWVRYSDYVILKTKLTKALKVIEPFAEAAEAMDNLHGPGLSDTTRVRPGIYIGELRAARNFLKENGNGE